MFSTVNFTYRDERAGEIPTGSEQKDSSVRHGDGERGPGPVACGAQGRLEVAIDDVRGVHILACRLDHQVYWLVRQVGIFEKVSDRYSEGLVVDELLVAVALQKLAGVPIRFEEKMLGNVASLNSGTYRRGN